MSACIGLVQQGTYPRIAVLGCWWRDSEGVITYRSMGEPVRMYVERSLA